MKTLFLSPRSGSFSFCRHSMNVEFMSYCRRLCSEGENIHGSGAGPALSSCWLGLQDCGDPEASCFLSVHVCSVPLRTDVLLSSRIQPLEPYCIAWHCAFQVGL